MATGTEMPPTPPKETTKAPQALIYDTRVFDASGSEVKFDVLVVDKAEKWITAEEIKSTHDLVLPGGKVVKIPTRCLSWGEYEDIENRYQIPPVPASDPGSNIVNIELNKARQKQIDEVVQKRRVEIFELSTGKSIPGKDISEKAAWLDNLGTGNADSLFNYITEICCGMSDDIPEALRLYNEHSNSKSFSEATELQSFEDLISAANINTSFRIQRPTEKNITEFVFKHISDGKKKEIEDAVPDPVPPSKPGKNPATGKPDASFPIYNWQDPTYQEALTGAGKVRTQMWMDAIFPFPIPGASVQERYQWIRKRPFGDVYKIRRFINEEIINYTGRLNFF